MDLEFVTDPLYTKAVSEDIASHNLTSVTNYPVEVTAWQTEVFALDAGITYVRTNPPVETGEVEFVPGLITDFYNRIHLIPNSPYNFPAIAADQDKEFKAWNSYTSDNTLASITLAGDAGFSVAGPVAVTYGRLEIKDYVLSISAAGVPVLTGTATFDFAMDPEVLTISGVRASLWSYWMQDGLTETLTPNTWTFTAKDGTEQRAKIRQIPTRKVTGKSLLEPTQWPYLQNLLHTQAGRKWIMPLDWESTLANISLTTSDTYISFDTGQAEYYVGGYIAIWLAHDNYHVSEIVDIDSGGIEFQTPPDSALSGYGKISPAIPARGDDSFKHSVDPAGNRNISFNFTAYEGENLNEYNYTDQLNGIDVLERFNEGNNVQQTIQTKVWINDFKLGLADWGPEYTSPKTSKSVKHTLIDKSDLWDFRQFVYDKQGHVPFWFSSNEDDLRLYSEITATTNTITVYDDNYQSLGQVMKDSLCIVHTDGSRDYRTISSVADGATAGTIDITFSTNLTNSTATSIIDGSVQFLSLCVIDGPVKFTHHGFKTIASYKLKESQE